MSGAMPSRPRETLAARSLLSLVAVAFVVFAFGCEGERLGSIPKDGTILAFGDSLTEGVGATASQSYPFFLDSITTQKVVNAGISGETTDMGRARFPNVLDDVNPDLVVLIEGGNDILRNRPLKETKRHLASIIEIANDKGVRVVLIGVPEKGLLLRSAPIYEELASEYELTFDGELLGRLLRKPELKSDPIHLNSAGYREMAIRIHGLLVSSGLVSSDGG